MGKRDRLKPELQTTDMIACAQRSLDLRIPTRRPLLPLKAAMVFLDRNEDDVLALANDGRLAWCFDLRGNGAERMLLYVWRTSAVEYVVGQFSEHTLREVISDVLPDRPYLRATEVKNTFSCNQGHLANLIAAGLIRTDRRREVAGRGPLSSPWVMTESVREFLRSRRIG